MADLAKFVIMWPRPDAQAGVASSSPISTGCGRSPSDCWLLTLTTRCGPTRGPMSGMKTPAHASLLTIIRSEWGEA